MRENNRKPIEKCRKKLPQFTTMNVIDGQAGLVIYSSLIFYSLTIDNILNIIVLLILAGVTIATLTGDNGILTRTEQAKKATGEAGAKEKVQVEALGSFDRYGNFDMNMLKENLKTNLGLQNNDIKDNGDGSILVTVDGYKVKVDNMGNVTMVGDEEIIVELTDIYPTLYTDGTLAFSNNNEIISGKEVSKQYANIKGQIYSYDNNARKPTTPWYDDWEKIKTVIFTNEIVPSNLDWWFSNLVNLTSMDLSGLNAINVTSMVATFSSVGLIELDLSNLNTLNVKNMGGMFEGSQNLEKITFGGKFSTENVTDMSYMFNYCTSLKNLDVSSFNTSKVTDMSYLFTNIDNYGDFNGTSKLKTIYVSEYNESTDTGWTTKLVENSKNMFTNCTNLVGGNGTKYDSAHVDKEYARIDKSDQTGYLTNK